eukprot:TRINITY_DN3365_c0_g1_i5.p1 TRINITY_DN3365_c0_g1~~TRINITY_DN3365_c0_g1_i5.p1  ORF type:complete len:172 (+),score=38.34 TRINITY_DN3365_c0_g1_i5:343-858(+)
MLLNYVPAAVKDFLLSTMDNQVISQIRVVSVLFCQVRGLDPSDKPDLRQRHTLIQALQKSIYRYEGTINKFLVDDKGFLMLAVFGVPPFPHVDDPLRAVMAAKMLQMNLNDIGLQSSVGITTGRVFCGLVGSEVRREFTVMGDTVNLSARLMAAAETDSTLCDASTQHACT